MYNKPIQHIQLLLDDKSYKITICQVWHTTCPAAALISDTIALCFGESISGHVSAAAVNKRGGQYCSVSQVSHRSKVN